MELNAQQKKAVEYLEGPLLVLAGPGTGKTQLLSKKVEYILKKTDANPNNILCLTFTDTGAANMRERLKSTIGEAALKVNIGTYHAFGSEILAQYKNYSEDYDRRLDAAIDEVAQYKIVKTIQDNLPGTDILRGDRVKDIISVISEAKSANLTADDLQKIAEQNIADAEVLSEEISPLLLKVVARKYQESLDNAYAPIYEILKVHEEDPPILPTVARSVRQMAHDLKEALYEADDKGSVAPLSSWKDGYFEKDEQGNYRLKDRVANKKLLSVAGVMRKYEAYLRENGLYDFDDMIQEAVKALKADAGFRATLTERYQYIMLDEFQDTNPSQLAIVQALTDYEKPQIMAVGDDDQAIYEFQGALSSNMLDFQKHYGANVIPLVDNYRSTQEILDFSKKIIEKAPDRFVPEKELISHKPDPKETEIHRLEFLGADAEYGFIAGKIAELVKSGVRQSEIAVISYKSKYFEPLLPYLKAHPEVKIAYEKRDNLFEDEKIHEILTVLTYVWELAQEKRVDTSALEILSYPCFRLPVLEVVRLVDKARRNKHSVFEELGASEITAFTEVAEFLASLTARSFTEPVMVLMSELVQKIDARITDEYERFRFYENLAALKGALSRHYGEQTVRLKELIELVRDYEAAEMTLAVKSPYRDADEAVQILTAHKAKGLEFEYVFIISADDTAWGKAGGNNNLLSLPKNLMQIRHTGTTDGEKLRILYVALTRAKKALYITNSKRDFGDKAPKRLQYFDEYESKDENGAEMIVSPLIPSRQVECMYDLPELAVREDNLRNYLATYAVSSPDMRAIYQERVDAWRMSASALTDFINIAWAGPQEFFKKYVLQAPREPDTESQAFGNLVHAVYEQVTNEGLTDEQAVEYYLSELTRRDLPSEIVQALRERGPADLAVSLKRYGAILRQGKAEVNLKPEQLVIAGVPVDGKIDHLIVDEVARTVEIYDFKTGAYEAKNWHKDVKAYVQMIQLVFYKLLLGQSREYAKYRVERAHLLFVTPDKKDREVHERVYEYNADDEREVLDLIRAVYNKVRTLEFMDDPELFIAGDRSRKMAGVMEFVGKIVS